MCMKAMKIVDMVQLGPVIGAYKSKCKQAYYFERPRLPTTMERMDILPHGFDMVEMVPNVSSLPALLKIEKALNSIHCGTGCEDVLKRMKKRLELLVKDEEYPFPVIGDLS